MGRRRTRNNGTPENDEPDLDGGNQVHGDEPQGHQPKRKRRELEQALEDIQGEVFAAEEELENTKQQLQEREAEIERLKNMDTQSSSNTGSANRPAQTAAGATAHGHSESDSREVRAAGRRCCVLHFPWMQGDCLFDTDVRNAFDAILGELEANRDAESHSSSDSEQEDPVDEFWRSPRYRIAAPVDIVREVVAHMDTSLAKRWFEPWFKTQFKTGMRKMRSEAVSTVANNRHTVFGLSDKEFGERHDRRAREIGAKSLFQDDAYLWAPDDPENPKTEFERFFRSDVTLNVAKLILQGGSAVGSEKRSTHAGPSRAVIWHVKAIIPSILSFVTIVIHFVLSGEPSFDKVTRSGNYMDLYEANLRLLETHRQKHRRVHNVMIKFYNKAVLPDIHSTEQPVAEQFIGMSAARKTFYLRMMEENEGGDDEGGENGQGGENSRNGENSENGENGEDGENADTE